MKKILFIIWSYSLGGGAEALLTMIVNHLNPQKYQIGIIEFYHSTIKKEPVNPNIRIYDAITFEGDREYQKKMYYAYHEPDKMIRKYIPAGYDLYVSFNYQIPSFLLPKGSRNIAWIHGAVFDLAETGMEGYRDLQDKAFERVTKIISISDITAYSIRTLFSKHTNKLIEIYNGISIEQVRKNAACFTEIRVKHPAVFWVGRLDDNKDPLRMLDIFMQISRKISSVHLYFLGKGELESQIRDRVELYGLCEQVHVLGYLENPFPVMKQADVCCMTSRSEGFPLSLLESTALGVPFVSTEIGGAKILSNGGRCGRVYKTDEEAVEAVCGMFGMSKELLKEECEKSVSRFDLNTYIDEIEGLFDEVLKKETAGNGVITWSDGESTEVFEDRDYYYRFPEGLIPRDCRVILYGAGDIGTNYYNYIKEKRVCQIVAWVDSAAGKYRKIGRDIKDIETISQMEYDVVLIAVMKEKIAESIRMELSRRGIPASKILWARPIF